MSTSLIGTIAFCWAFAFGICGLASIIRMQWSGLWLIGAAAIGVAVMMWDLSLGEEEAG